MRSASRGSEQFERDEFVRSFRLAEMVRLTANAKAAGCAAKLSPSVLDSVLKRLPAQNDANVIVGFETSDDAAVYRISDDLALVQTADFFTPIVDDPETFGKIAAANALSDVYAMGGRPISSLTLVAFPPAAGQEVLEQILRGGLAKMSEAGCTVVGGHSIRDEEVKFGYAVTGLIHPKNIWRNVGALPGDVLFLTKSIGTGVISTALKQAKAPESWVAAAMESMARLNDQAAAALHELEDSLPGAGPVHAVTDVTGFGLLGHAREMAIGSGVSLRLEHDRVSYLEGAIEAARGGYFSGGMKNNRDFVESCVEFRNVPAEFCALLFDPQTSGGLLVAIDPRHADAARRAFMNHRIQASEIGGVIPKKSPLIEIA